MTVMKAVMYNCHLQKLETQKTYLMNLQIWLMEFPGRMLKV